MYEQMRPDISRKMAASAERNGYTYLDLIDGFREIKEKTFTDYCHLTPRGNEVIAERLYQAMSPVLIPKLLNGTAAAMSSASR
jgi:hypothetical protein